MSADEPPARHTRPADMTSGARRRQRLESAAELSGPLPPAGLAEPAAAGRASSAPPSFDDPNPPLKNRMLHLVDVRDKLAEAKARHAGQAASTTQPEAVPADAGEPKAKSLGAAKSKSKALAFVGSLSDQQSFLQGRPPSPPCTKNLGRMAWTRPREDCTTTDCVRTEADGNELSLGFGTIEADDLAEVMGMEDVKLVLLSFFDGIGAAHVALSNLGVKPCFAMSFETDEECKSVIRAQFPDVGLIGSYDLYAAEELMECIKKGNRSDRRSRDPRRSRAPLPRFQSDQGQHLQGSHRSRRREVRQVQQALVCVLAAAHSRRWAFHFVVENVVMNAHEAHYFNTRLGVQSFIMDAGDMTCASRPRLR